MTKAGAQKIKHISWGGIAGKQKSQDWNTDLSDAGACVVLCYITFTVVLLLARLGDSISLNETWRQRNTDLEIQHVVK